MLLGWCDCGAREIAIRCPCRVGRHLLQGQETMGDCIDHLPWDGERCSAASAAVKQQLTDMCKQGCFFFLFCSNQESSQTSHPQKITPTPSFVARSDPIDPSQPNRKVVKDIKCIFWTAERHGLVRKMARKPGGKPNQRGNQLATDGGDSGWFSESKGNTANQATSSSGRLTGRRWVMGEW